MSLFVNTNGVPLYEGGKTTHVEVGPGDLAQRIITVGAPSRLEKLALLFDSQDYKRINSKRGFTTVTGTFNGVPLSIVAIGMGFPMMDIFLREALAVVSGKIAIVRFGTCGGIGPSVGPGDIVVASKGSGFVLRNPDSFLQYYQRPMFATTTSTAHESVSDVSKSYLTFHPAPSYQPLGALIAAELTPIIGGHRVHQGMNVTADSFYSSQGRVDSERFDDQNAEVISQIRERYPEAMSLEMETFMLFHLGACHQPDPVYTSACAIVMSNRFSGVVVDAEEVSRHESIGGRAVMAAITKFNFE